MNNQIICRELEVTVAYLKNYFNTDDANWILTELSKVIHSQATCKVLAQQIEENTAPEGCGKLLAIINTI